MRKIPETEEAKKAYILSKVPKDDLPDEATLNDFINHTYRAMQDYGMDTDDSNRWAWLNTLFGYDIGAERAILLIDLCNDYNIDVMELNADDQEFLETVAAELGLHFNFSSFASHTPDTIRYNVPEYI